MMRTLRLPGSTPCRRCGLRACARRCDELNGLIQHSFAMQMGREHRSFHGARIHQMVSERFSRADAGFCLAAVGGLADQSDLERLAQHSPLVQGLETNVVVQRASFLKRKPWGAYALDLPAAFSWSGEWEERPGDCKQREPRLVLAEREAGREASLNDYQVHFPAVAEEPEAPLISQLLLELIAYKRSMLFGLALANRLVNVLLPYARLEPSSLPEGQREQCMKGAPGGWLLQPLVSLIRVNDGEKGFRPVYSLTLLLIPVSGKRQGSSRELDLEQRKMPLCEIDCMVNAGWSLAAAPWHDAVPQFDVSGPLCDYLSCLVQIEDLLYGSQKQAGTAGRSRSPRTLRQLAEVIAFSVALAIARRQSKPAPRYLRREIGGRVITSLGSARVSSAVLVDRRLDPRKVMARPRDGRKPPGCLQPVMERLAAGEARVPSRWTEREHRRYRVDRNFVDNGNYAVGVLPTSSCLVVTSASCAQYGRRESGLLQAGSIAYMTIAAATAIGTIRAIDRELEGLTDAKPSKIAEIEGEITVDLHEIYDLDITEEGYRRLYRLLRDRLGITRDYEALQEKMRALDRETTTRHELRNDRLLAGLTAAIVALSILILVATLAK